MALDFSDPSKLQTRDGRKVRIYATDHNGQFCVAGAIKHKDGWFAAHWDSHGSFISADVKDAHDIIPKPQRATGWASVYKDPNGVILKGLYVDKLDAVMNQGKGCIGQIYIDAEVQ